MDAGEASRAIAPGARPVLREVLLSFVMAVVDRDEDETANESSLATLRSASWTPAACAPQLPQRRLRLL
jgi:hypothetical protein